MYFRFPEICAALSFTFLVCRFWLLCQKWRLETRNSKHHGCFLAKLNFLTATLALLMPFAAQPAAAADRELRVCADPNNLPFSNQHGEGFENRIAEVIAREQNAALTYEWWAQRRGFVRNTLREGRCDLIVGVPAGYDPVLTTRPYYRSTYAFVSRADRQLRIDWFDDPRLRQLKIGVQLMGDDGANAPPAHALARRGIIRNVVGYTIYGDYSEANPPARLIDAVSSGAIDLAIAWGPLAGFFASRETMPLTITPVAKPTDPPGLRFTFAIAMGVRKGETALRDELNLILAKRRAEIKKILDDYRVPQVMEPDE
jgi:quinoprotein dehydrogenase-associated probable ABC transporter substrate-binding protein